MTGLVVVRGAEAPDNVIFGGGHDGRSQRQRSGICTNGGLYPIVGVDDIVVTYWSLFRAQLPNHAVETYHVVGSEARSLEGRVCSPIVAIDPDKPAVRTKSRWYVLAGKSAELLDDARYTLRAWLRIAGNAPASPVDSDGDGIDKLAALLPNERYPHADDG